MTHPATGTRVANFAHKAIGGFLIGSTLLLALNATGMVSFIVRKANRVSKDRAAGLEVPKVDERPLPNI
ncbi:hypothetical protein BC832DRAFT_546424 [Gaertneriomyces semiglobifer]|nr:hypothetical protein BC832DRAFT_546424 [Gaertneriomyces semiglobifer]